MTLIDAAGGAARRRASDLDGVRLTAAETAQRLGVKLPTVYAYVSRGRVQVRSKAVISSLLVGHAHRAGGRHARMNAGRIVTP